MLCLLIPYLKRVRGVRNRAAWPLCHTWRNANRSTLHAGHVVRTVSSAVRSDAKLVLVSPIHVRARPVVASEKEALAGRQVVARLRSQLHGRAVGLEAGAWPVEELDHPDVDARVAERPGRAVGRDLLILEVCAGLHRHRFGAGRGHQGVEQ